MKQIIWWLSLATAGFILASCAPQEKEQVTLQFLQTSDLHNRFQAYEYASLSETKGGLSRVASLVKKLRSENSEGTILLDTGDTFEDNFSEIFLRDGADISQNPMLLAMNTLGFDVWVPGNHEFNFGVGVLEEFAEGLKSQTLLANVYDGEGNRLFPPYTILERQGVKIGIVGVVTPHITKWDATNLTGYKVTSPYDEIEALLPEIEEQADIVLIASHMAVPVEHGEDSAQELARRFPQVAVVFASHAHDTVLEREGEVLLVEPAKYGEKLSLVNIKVTKEGDRWVIADRLKDIQGEVITLSQEEEDEELLAVTSPAHQKALAHGSKEIGRLVGGDLAYPDRVAGVTQAHLEPSPILSLIAEVILEASEADVASVSLLRDDANLKEGVIRLSDVSLIYKYDNALRVYSMTGRQLKKYMEWAARFYQQASPEDLTVAFNPKIPGYNNDLFAGVSYDINISKPEGERIENLIWIKNGKPVSDEEIITLATNNYRGQTLFEGGLDGVFEKGDAPLLVRDLGDELGSDGGIRALIVRYIESKGGVISATVNPTILDFRITGFNPDPALVSELETLSAQGKIGAPKTETRLSTNVRPLRESDLVRAKK